MKLTPAQRYAVRFLAAGNEISVDLICNTGRSREWPTRATLGSLQRKGLVKFTTCLGGWSCELTDEGRAMAAQLRAD